MILEDELDTETSNKILFSYGYMLHHDFKLKKILKMINQFILSIIELDRKLTYMDKIFCH